MARLYAPPGALILDVAWGTGRFWRGGERPAVAGSDVLPAPGVRLAADFRALPHADGCAGIVVPTGPTATTPGVEHAHRRDRHAATSRYDGNITTASLDNRGIVRPYRDGMAGVFGVLKPEGGQCWVKVKNEGAGSPAMGAAEDRGHGLFRGFTVRDGFVLLASARQADRGNAAGSR